jgi:hypothetical protein
VGVGNLVDADLAKESANLQALQTKQQLGIQALSIANQSSSTLRGLYTSAVWGRWGRSRPHRPHLHFMSLRAVWPPTRAVALAASWQRACDLRPAPASGPSERRC